MTKIKPFEKYSSQYEDWFEKNKFAYESELRAIKKLIPEGKKGLEIGVGSGRFAHPLGIKIGIEPSKKMATIAKRRGINVIDSVAEKLLFENATFDFVLMVTTICFLDNIQKAFSEAYRVLKEKGLLILGFIDKNSPLGKLYQEKKDKSVFYKNATFYSADELTSCLKETGFTSFNFAQTIFHNLKDIKNIEPIKPGYGEGSFVVIRAQKQ